MKNWSINTRVLFITLFPLALISIALNAYFTITRFAEMQETIIKQGHSLAFHIAAASEYGVLSGNTVFLKKLTNAALSSAEIMKVTISDTNKNILLVNNKENGNTDSSNRIFDFFYDLLNPDEEYLNFTKPIISEKIHIDDYPQEDINKDISAASNTEVIGYASIYISPKLSAQRQIFSIIKSNMILLLIFLMSVYLALRLSDEISNTVSNISKTVHRIESGDLHSRVDIQAGGEIGQLSRGINNMAEAMQDSDRHLRIEIDKATANLRNSYIEIEKQNKRLIHARSIADSANQAKSNFLANISHEIRTPINGVVGFTDVLLKTSLTQQQIEYVNTIRSASNSLMHLITDLLDFARIESGKMTFESVTFDIRSVMENIHTIYSNNAYQKGLELLVDIDRKLPNKLISDPIRIEQIFINLISNAIKFTKTGCIEIKILLNKSSYDDIELKCCVSDTGIGLSKGEVERIFKEFEQADQSTSRHYGGTGLGLSITKHIVERLNGEIYVESQKDKGSTFYFTISCGYSDQETDFKSYNYNDRTIYFVDTLAQSQNSYMELFKSIGFKTINANNPESIPPANDRENKGVLIFSIDARCNIGNNFSGLIEKYSTIAMDKIAFVSSNNSDIHKALIEAGFDYVIPKTINRTQLLNAFSANLISEYSTIPEKVTDATQVKSTPSTKILVVDDNEINAKILEAYLKPLQLDTFTASDGEKALALLNEHDIHLIFMDVHMPILNGYAATKIIRNLDSSKAKTPIIGITADGLQESIQKCLSAGMNHCLIKPITSQDVEGIINRWVLKKKNPHKKQPKIQLTDELSAMLISELPAFREQLKAANKENNIDAIFHIAHKISGGSAYCNLPDLRRSALALQSATRDNNKQNINHTNICRRAEQLLDEINQLITDHLE